MQIVVGFETREKDLYFYVSDMGIEIPEDKQKEVFNRFVKLDNFKMVRGWVYQFVKRL